MEERHNYFLNQVLEYLEDNGFKVSKEVKLPKGKGSIDILARKGEFQLNGEVKSSPASVTMKNVRKQLVKYEFHFGGQSVLFSPSGNSIIAQTLEGPKNLLEDFVEKYSI